MQPAWLIVVATLSILASVASAAAIGVDILGGRRQGKAIMNLGWPVTALCLGPFGLLAYRVPAHPTASRASQHHDGHDQGHEHGGGNGKSPSWGTVFKATSHCGAGCTLADMIAESGIYLLGFTLLGSRLATAFLFDFLLAYAFGIVFQFFTFAPMLGLGLQDGLKAAVKADTISLVARRGEVVGLEGPSGTGKSALLFILGCLLTPSSGRVVIEIVVAVPRRPSRPPRCASGRSGSSSSTSNCSPHWPRSRT
jgi:hypothetical protein